MKVVHCWCRYISITYLPSFFRTLLRSVICSPRDEKDAAQKRNRVAKIFCMFCIHCHSSSEQDLRAHLYAMVVPWSSSPSLEWSCMVIVQDTQDIRFIMSIIFVACRLAVEMLGEEQGWTLKMFLAGSDAGVDFTGLIGPEPSPTDYDSVLRRFNGSPLFTALWWSNHCSIVTFFQRGWRLDYIILVLSFCRDPNAALMEFARSWRYSFIRDMSPLNSEPKFSY